MGPDICKLCGRPVTKCVCPVDDILEEDEDQDEMEEVFNTHGDDDWGTPDTGYEDFNDPGNE